MLILQVTKTSILHFERGKSEITVRFCFKIGEMSNIEIKEIKNSFCDWK